MGLEAAQKRSPYSFYDSEEDGEEEIYGLKSCKRLKITPKRREASRSEEEGGLSEEGFEDFSTTRALDGGIPQDGRIVAVDGKGPRSVEGTALTQGLANDKRPDKAFTTERAKKNGLANACSGRIFVNCPRDHFGPITADYDPVNRTGVLVGTEWANRLECRQWGAHLPHVAGIAGQSGYGAQSVALSGGYEDDEDHGWYFIYTGSGGRDLSGNKRTNKEQSKEQVFEKYNLALKVSCQEGYPVRVVRSHKERNSAFAPRNKVVRYDGVYRIEKCWRKRGKQNAIMCRFLFVRCDNEPPPWARDGGCDAPNPEIPEIEELEGAQDVFERVTPPAWDWKGGEEGYWGWTRDPPSSQEKAPKNPPGKRKRPSKGAIVQYEPSSLAEPAPSESDDSDQPLRLRLTHSADDDSNTSDNKRLRTADVATTEETPVPAPTSSGSSDEVSATSGPGNDDVSGAAEDVIGEDASGVKGVEVALDDVSECSDAESAGVTVGPSDGPPETELGGSGPKDSEAQDALTPKKQSGSTEKKEPVEGGVKDLGGDALLTILTPEPRSEAACTESPLEPRKLDFSGLADAHKGDPVQESMQEGGERKGDGVKEQGAGMLPGVLTPNGSGESSGADEPGVETNLPPAFEPEGSPDRLDGNSPVRDSSPLEDVSGIAGRQQKRSRRKAELVEKLRALEWAKEQLAERQRFLDRLLSKQGEHGPKMEPGTVSGLELFEQGDKKRGGVQLNDAVAPGPLLEGPTEREPRCDRKSGSGEFGGRVDGSAICDSIARPNPSSKRASGDVAEALPSACAEGKPDKEVALEGRNRVGTGAGQFLTSAENLGGEGAPGEGPPTPDHLEKVRKPDSPTSEPAGRSLELQPGALEDRLGTEVSQFKVGRDVPGTQAGGPQSLAGNRADELECELEGTVSASEAQAREMERNWQEAEERARLAEERARLAEERAQLSEERARLMEERALQTKEKALASAEKLRKGDALRQALEERVEARLGAEPADGKKVLEKECKTLHERLLFLLWDQKTVVQSRALGRSEEDIARGLVESVQALTDLLAELEGPSGIRTGGLIERARAQLLGLRGDVRRSQEDAEVLGVWLAESVQMREEAEQALGEALKTARGLEDVDCKGDPSLPRVEVAVQTDAPWPGKEERSPEAWAHADVGSSRADVSKLRSELEEIKGQYAALVGLIKQRV